MRKLLALILCLALAAGLVPAFAEEDVEIIWIDLDEGTVSEAADELYEESAEDAEECADFVNPDMSLCL